MSPCTCQFPDGEKQIWCERHRCWKTKAWHKLCQTKEKYRQLWDDGYGPGQIRPNTPRKAPPGKPKPLAHYLNCPHRDRVIAETTGTVAGVGCGGTKVEFFMCLYFNEPVLKGCRTWSQNRNRDKLRDACPGFNGRTCRECVLWKGVKLGP